MIATFDGGPFAGDTGTIVDAVRLRGHIAVAVETDNLDETGLYVLDPGTPLTAACGTFRWQGPPPTAVSACAVGS